MKHLLLLSFFAFATSLPLTQLNSTTSTEISPMANSTFVPSLSLNSTEPSTNQHPELSDVNSTIMIPSSTTHVSGNANSTVSDINVTTVKEEEESSGETEPTSLSNSTISEELETTTTECIDISTTEREEEETTTELPDAEEMETPDIVKRSIDHVTASNGAYLICFMVICPVLLVIGFIFRLRRSRKVQGMYSPAWEERFLTAVYSVPTEYVTADERLI